MTRHRLHHSTPPITYRLKVLHIRHTHLSKLESQYPDEISSQAFTYPTKYPNFINSSKSAKLARPFSVLSTAANSITQSSISGIPGSGNNSITGSSATLATTNSGDLLNKSTKIHLKYRALVTHEEDILPGA